MRIRRLVQRYPYREELEWCSFCNKRHTSDKDAPILRLPLDLSLFIVSLLPFSDRRSLHDSCLHMEKLVATPVTTRVRNTLRTFGLDPAPFLESMQYYGAVIGGMAALRIFAEEVPMPRVLEVYDDNDASDDRGNGYRLVDTLLHTYEKCTVLGYRHYGYGDNIVKIFRMVNTTLDREILFIQCRVPPIALITEAPTTALMNFITSNDAVCLYPELTEARKGLFTIVIPEDGSSTFDIPVFDRLVGHGFTMFENATRAIGRHLCPMNPSCPALSRAYPDLLMYSVHFTDAGSYGSRIPSITWNLNVPSSCGSSERIQTGVYLYFTVKWTRS
ncbi:hypothetical protein D9611_015161 [Ephemerocybe angulata]|uniref:F-box domain-containing protein n=1 Tax=Ephemerocybe angulata TaxID=980116 RepID=A0A8H5BRR4_9AGAR|nr:hypothetical protein D9611_015161 [Tulosesus angulatus]